METKKIHFLIIEDSSDDAELIQHEIKKHYAESDFLIADTEEAMRNTMRERLPDFVISDYRMPGFSGPEALRVHREFDEDIPFIIVSGTIGEEIAVEMMKAGARDYIMKNNLSRLIPSIKRELQNTIERRQKKRTDELLNISEQRFRNISEIISDYAYSERILEDGTMEPEWVTDAYYRYFDLSPEEMHERGGINAYIHPEDVDIFNHRLKALLSGQIQVTEYRIVDKNQHIRWFRDYGKPEWNVEKKRIIRILGAVQDITEQKTAYEQIKRSEHKYRKLHESMMDGFVLVDMNGLIKDCNQVYQDMLGYTLEELKSLTYADFTPEKWQEYEKGIVQEEILKRGFSGIYEKEYIRKDKTTIAVELRNFLIKDEQDQNEGMWAIVRDISERKHNEEALYQSEAKYRRIVETANEGIWIIDSENKTVSVNQKMAQMLGYTQEEMQNRLMDDYIVEWELKDHAEKISRRKTGVKESYERRFRHKGGKLVWMQVSATPITDEQGNYAGSFAMMTDISERKKYEMDLKESEYKYRTLFNQMNEMAIINEFIFNEENKPVNYRIIDCNQAFTKITGIQAGDAIGKTATELYRQQAPPYLDIYTKVNLTREPTVFETYDTVLKRQLLISVFSPALNYFVTVTTDLTEKKEAEKKLIESEEKYRYLFETNPHPMWVYDLETLTFLAVNEAAVRKYGYTREEFSRMNLRDIRPQDEIARLEDDVKRERPVIQQTEGWHHRLKDGTVIDVEIHSHLIDYENRKAALVITQDVTKKKKAEIELIASQKNLIKAQEIGQLGSWDWNIQNGTLRWSDELYRIAGVTKDYPLTYDTVLQLVHPDDRPKNNEIVSRMLKTGEKVRFEFRFVRPSGEIRYIDQRIELVTDKKGIIVLAIGVMQDITDRKQAEHALFNSEMKYRLIVENQKDIIVKTDLDGRFTFVSQSYCELFGKTESELLGMSYTPFVHPDDKPIVDEAFKKLFSPPYNCYYEERAITVYGWRWISWNAKAIVDSSGNITELLGTGRDVTLRKELENQLRETSRFIDSVMNALSAHICVLDADGNILMVNRAWRQFAEQNQSNPNDYSEGANYLDVCDKAKGPYSEGAQDFAKGIRQVIAEETDQFEMEYPCHSPHEKRWFIGRVTRVSGKEKKQIVIAHENISNRKIAEMTLAASEEKFREFIHQSLEGITVINNEGRIVEWNEMNEKITGITRARAVSSYIWDIQFSLISTEQRIPERMEYFKKIIQSAGVSGSSPIFDIIFDVSILTPNGEKRIIQQLIFPIRTQQENLIGLLNRDVTELRRKEEESRRQQVLLQTASSAGKVALWEWDIASGEMTWSDTIKQILGLKEEELPDRYSIWESLLHPEDKPVMIHALNAHFNEEAPFDLDCRFKHSNENYIWMKITGQSERNINGIPTRLIGAAVDINERKRLDLAHQAAIREWNSTFTAINDSIMLLTKNFNIIRCNESTIKMFGKPYQEIVGRYCWEILHGSKCPPADCPLKRVMQSKNHEEQEMLIGDRWYEISVDPNLNSSGEIVSLIHIVRDITRRKLIDEKLRKNEEQYRTLIEKMNDGLIYVDNEDKILFVNRRLCRMLEYEENQLVGQKGIDTVIYPEDRRILSEKNEQRKAGLAEEYEIRFVTASGKLLWTSVSASPIMNDQQVVIGSIGIISDIGVKKMYETALIENEERYRTFLNSTEDLVYIKDDHFQYVMVNRANQMFLGKPHDEIIGYTDHDLMPKETADACRESDQKALASDEIIISYEAIDHQIFEARKFKLTLPGGYTGIGAFIRDITETRIAQIALENQMSLMQTLFDVIPTPIFYKNRQGIYIDCNKAFEQFINKPKKEIIGKTVFDIASPDIAKLYHQADEALLLQGGVQVYESKIQTKNDDWRIVIFHKTVFMNRIDNQEGIVGVILDITERKKAEDQLRRLSRAVEQSPVSVVITDTEGQIQYVNPKYEEVTGYTINELIGRNQNILKSGMTPVEIYPELWKTIQSGEDWNGEFINRKKDGTLFIESATITPIFDDNNQISEFLGIKEDITEKKKMQEELNQSQKMESLGRLAGGIAHDFNNLLTGIIGYSNFILKSLPKDNVSYPDVEEIKKAGDKAAALTRQLLAFGSKRSITLQPLQINEAINNMSKMIKRIIGEDITFTSQLDPNLSMTSADPSQLDQILMNLIVNARDAMPVGGNLTIRTFNHQGDLPTYLNQPGFSDKTYIVIEIEDNGVGISSEIISKIFDPFFTTKGKDKGSGLGLAVVYSIVKQYKGFVTVESTHGESTIFRIFLPAIHTVPENIPIQDDGDKEIQGVETIFIVEDEEEIRSIIKRILTNKGYQIIESKDVDDALHTYQKRYQDIDLVISDVIMPKMNGFQLYEKFKEINSSVKTVFMSGYMDDRIFNEQNEKEEIVLIPKPFSEEALLQKIQQVLKRK